MDDRLQRWIHLACGFVVGAVMGGFGGAMAGTYVGYHRKILDDPIPRDTSFNPYEVDWAQAWPWAVGGALLVGLVVAFRWEAFWGAIRHRLGMHHEEVP